MSLAFTNAMREMRFKPRGLCSVTKEGKGSSNPPKAKNTSHRVSKGAAGSGEASVFLDGMLQEMSPGCHPWCISARVGQDLDGVLCTPIPCRPPPPAHAITGCAPCRGAAVLACWMSFPDPHSAAPVRQEHCAGKKGLLLCGGRQGAFVPAGLPRSRGGQWDLQQPCAARSPLEVVVAMGSIVTGFPPVLYILHLAFSQGEQ